LLDNSIDIAIHSLKDLPSERNSNLESFTVTKREDPMDVLVVKKNLKIKELKDLKLIGTSSIRRQKQIQMIHNDVKVRSIRGNVETRIQKLDKGEYDAIILAAAGLKRLGLEQRITKYFDSNEITPAAGQGALAVEFRKNDKKTLSILKKIQDKSTEICVKEERNFLKTVGGGCSSPDAVLCTFQNNTIKIEGKIYDSNRKKYISGKLVKDIGNHRDIGVTLAEQLISKLSTSIAKNIILTNEGDINGFNSLVKNNFKVHHYPLIEIESIEFKINDLESYDYVVFTSKNGVKSFFNKVKINCDIKFISIGYKTEKMLNKYGYFSSYISKKNYSEIMAEELKKNKFINGKNVLLIQGQLAKDNLKLELKKLCNVDRINVYNTKAKENSNEKLKKLISSKSTFTVFTSPSAFDSYIKFYNPNKTKIISIGKTTTKYIESKGYDCMLTSQMQTYEGISASIIKYFHQL
jgi:hydroxymethylbilane synthase